MGMALGCKWEWRGLMRGCGVDLRRDVAWSGQETRRWWFQMTVGDPSIWTSVTRRYVRRSLVHVYAYLFVETKKDVIRTKKDMMGTKKGVMKTKKEMTKNLDM